MEQRMRIARVQTDWLARTKRVRTMERAASSGTAKTTSRERDGS